MNDRPEDKQENPFGILDDDEHNPEVINDIFQTDRDWDRYHRIVAEEDERVRTNGIVKRSAD